MNRLLFALTALFALNSGLAHADVIPPDMKGVRNVITVKGLKKFKGKRFIIAPINHFPAKKGIKWAEIKEGQELRWGRYSSPKIYVVDDPKFDLKKIDDAWFKDKSRVVSNISLSNQRFVNRSSTAETLVITYTLKEIKKGKLIVETKHVFLDKDGKPAKAASRWLWILPLLSLLALGLIALTRKLSGAGQGAKEVEKELVAA